VIRALIQGAVGGGVISAVMLFVVGASRLAVLAGALILVALAAVALVRPTFATWLILGRRNRGVR
jgi:hypothetical protein